MKLLTVLAAGAVLAFSGAASAHADPELGAQASADDAGVHHAAFLESLRAAGITYSSPSQAIDAARTVCGLVDRGETGLQVITDLKDNNPGFTTDGAAQFAAIAANVYCPHQLTKK
ncbi:DUF732 domain-containing protein [[Mycobacterium] nativiensis]|uniref:DUF732 domain-containing protein n=1 Tax=[Mycobacterium] nativiensis TaxID=2855503 RepID=A0ABU5Y351_9MYCO|nr:DUF732 domain-containing protein [Mycolicibacter sp. MYC340]MEB3033656.1 DUF732 domain-containing protein [Mycolicibacter sp. MYC340]